MEVESRIITPRLREIVVRRSVTSDDHSLNTVLSEICNVIRTSVGSDEKVGLKIKLNDAYPLHIEYRHEDRVTPVAIMDRLSNMFQSNSALIVTHIRVEARILRLYSL